VQGNFCGVYHNVESVVNMAFVRAVNFTSVVNVMKGTTPLLSRLTHVSVYCRHFHNDNDDDNKNNNL